MSKMKRWRAQQAFSKRYAHGGAEPREDDAFMAAFWAHHLAYLDALKASHCWAPELWLPSHWRDAVDGVL